MTPHPEEQNWTTFTLLKLSGYGFGMIGFLLAMDTIILPVLVMGVAPAEWKNTYLAMLAFGGLAVGGLMQPIIGRASDNTRSPLGRRIPYMLWGSLFVSLGLVGIGFAPNYLSLFAVWLFLQANLNIGYGPYQALIRDLVPLSRVGVASSIKILSDASGGLVLISMSAALIGRSASSTVDRWVWLTLGIIAISLLLTTLVTSLTVRSREAAPEIARRVSELVRAPNLPLHPQIRRFLVSRLLIMTAVTAFPTFGLFFLEDLVELENATQTLGQMIVVIGGALAFSVYPAGWVSDRIGRKPVVMAGAMGAAASSIWLLWATDVTGVLVSASALGAAIGVLLSSNWALANELGTKGREGLHMGVINLATTGGAAAAKVMGPGIDLLNRSADGAGYQALLITCASLFLVGAFLLMPLRVETPIPVPSAQSPEEAG